MDASSAHTPTRPPAPGIPPLDRSLALVGLMGAGKSSIGRRLARMLRADFADADDEIVAAAGMGIPDIFAVYGEPVFRDLERRVVARLLERPPLVLALGGGAFVDPATRAKVKASARSVWLRADLDTLVARTGRKRGARPLLAAGGDPREVLDRLMRERYPVYAEADHAIETATEGPDAAAWRIVALLRDASEAA
jgi:shikimate kinase